MGASPTPRAATMAKSLTALILLACLASAVVASPNRRLLGGGGGGGWDGGIQTQDILSENAAISGIENAVSTDQYANTYAATEGGYQDSYAAAFPDDNNGEFWLNPAQQNGK
ncbi:MAG: hypothetical protein J3K34DRAFT_467651 [Monoraphidium minutum]|nr:MAG: hypothetical protein J3K34DRAFT_467651 [Monoraphidium minutum]